MLPLKIVTTQKKFVHPNIMTLRKSTTFKYLTKIHFPCFVSMHFRSIKILMTYNISWIALKSVDIIAISESWITKQVSLSNNLNLNNYSFQFTTTETSAGGALLYIANHLSYKCCSDLNIYTKNELESTLLKLSAQGNQIL